ncbi:ybeQ, partial [Symbiodinium sp. KB8]
CDLGVLYAQGQGVPQDASKAKDWLRKAAKKGNAAAQSNLGSLYAHDPDGQDLKKAYKWYRKAAEAGNAAAQVNLALMYDEGQGIVQDDKRASKWYKRAAEAGNSIAQANLAQMYLDGRGVRKNPGKAVRWLEAAAEEGHVDAALHLGWMFAEGEGVEQDQERACRWLALAARAGHPQAQCSLGRMYMKGTGVPLDLQMAYECFLQAAAQDDADALYNLAVMTQHGVGVAEDLDAAKELFQKAAALGHQAAADQVLQLLPRLKPQLGPARTPPAEVEGWRLFHTLCRVIGSPPIAFAAKPRMCFDGASEPQSKVQPPFVATLLPWTTTVEAKVAMAGSAPPLSWRQKLFIAGYAPMTALFMGVAAPQLGRAAAFFLMGIWTLSTVSLWTAPISLEDIPHGQLGALVLHGVSHAALCLAYTSSFPRIFKSDDARAAAVGYKQQFVIVLKSWDAWAYLLSDFLSAMANALVTNAFPLLVGHVFRFGVDIPGAMMSISSVPPLAAALRPFAAALLPTEAFIQNKDTPDSDFWDILVPGAALLPVLYFVFYVAGGLAGPMWAHIARLRVLSWSTLFAIGVAAYSVGLYSVMGIRSYHSALLNVGLTGAMLSVFLVLPELFSGAVVDNLSEAARPAGAQALFALKSLLRRGSGALQGVLTSYVLAQAHFNKAADPATAATTQAVHKLFCWYPAALLVASAVLLLTTSLGKPHVKLVLGGRRALARRHAAHEAEGSAEAKGESTPAGGLRKRGTTGPAK